nr:putative ribonuclease H-like domain-containing protein [Tanacetum cinerariifolium]
DEDPRKENECNDQEKEDNVNSTNNVNNVRLTFNVAGTNKDNKLPFDPNMPALEDVSIFNFSNDDEDDDIDESGIVIRHKARLVAQGHIQEKGINYDEVFAPVARIEAIRLFLAYASFADFMVYQMDAKSIFRYGKIKPEVYACQPPRFEDPYFPDREYKVEKALYGLHQAPKAWYETLSTYLLDNGFQRGNFDKTLFIKRHKAYTDSDYAEASLDRKSTTGGCQFLGCRLISWQCKKYTAVANSITEAKYVAASSCYRQVLWIQNQLLDYGLIDLEKTNTTQANVIDSLKMRVKKLKRGIDLGGEEVFVEQEVVTYKEKINEVTLAQALAELKTSKPKAKGDVIQEPSKSSITTTTIPKQKSQDKGKGILLQAKFDEEQRLTREKAEKELEANIALIETWDDVQVKIDAAHQLAERLQVEEQQELTNEENATLVMQFLEKRKKFIVSKRAEEKRNKPPTQAQKRKIMCTYLKNMEGYTLNHLKEFKFNKDKKKRAREELIQKSEKKQKVEDNKETTELKKLMEIIIDKEDVAINAIPLDVKSLGIVDWKIYKEGKKSYYQIIRADGKCQMYMFFIQMLTRFDTKDLEDIYKLVKAKYGSRSPVEDLDLLLWGDLKTMFKPHVEDVVWRKKQGYKVLEWNQYDSCRVHYLRMQSM